VIGFLYRYWWQTSLGEGGKSILALFSTVTSGSFCQLLDLAIALLGKSLYRSWWQPVLKF